MATKRALIAIALVGVPTCLAHAADVAPAEVAVKVVTAKTSCFANVVRASGTIVPRAMAVVMFNMPGFQVTEVSKREGDSVQAGEQVAAALSVGAPASPTDADHRDVATKRIAIKSPVAGLVLGRQPDSGTSPNRPLLTLAVDGEMEAVIDVTNIHALELNSGQNARVATDDGREFNGHVRLAPAEINRLTQVGQARVSIDSGQSLRQGLFVHVMIDIGRSCNPSVPLTAIWRDNDGAKVQVVKDGTVEIRAVALGLANDIDAEVRRGLVESDVVVVDADAALRGGDKVRPTPADSRDTR